MDDLHLKLQLTAEDVRFVREQFLSAADAKIKVHLPQMTFEGQDKPKEDPMRTKVEQLVKEFIHESFELTRHGMMVDGVDMSKRPVLRDDLAAPREEIEPFDFELNDNLRQLYGKVDALTLEIARLRKTLPAEATKVYSEALEKRRLSQKQQEDDISKDLQREVDALDDEFDATESEERRKQLDQIKQDYYGVIEQLGTLIKTVPESKAQLDQLDETVEFLKNA